MSFLRCRYKTLVQSPASGPLSLETCGCSFQVGIEMNRKAFTCQHLIDIVDPAQSHMLCKVQPERTKGPFKSGTIEQYVWTSIKYQTIFFKAGCKPPGIGASFDHSNTQSLLRQSDCGG